MVVCLHSDIESLGIGVSGRWWMWCLGGVEMFVWCWDARVNLGYLGGTGVTG